MQFRPSGKERRLALATGQADLDAKQQQSDLAAQQAEFSQLSQLYGLDERSQRLPGELEAQQAATDATIGASGLAEAMAPLQQKSAQLANYNTEAMAPIQLGLGKAQIGLAGSQAAGMDAETAVRQQQVQANEPASRVALEGAQARAQDMTAHMAPVHYATDVATNIPPDRTPDWLNEAIIHYMPPEVQGTFRHDKQKKEHGAQRSRDMQLQALLNSGESHFPPGTGAAFGLTDEQLQKLTGKPIGPLAFIKSQISKGIENPGLGQPISFAH